MKKRVVAVVSFLEVNLASGPTVDLRQLRYFFYTVELNSYHLASEYVRIVRGCCLLLCQLFPSGAQWVIAHPRGAGVTPSG